MHPLNDPFLDKVGNTPLVPLTHLFANDKGIDVFAKLEYCNPTGSIKDRIVYHIIGDAERRGLLKPGMTVIEATSGNTGAALAALGARRGYKVLLTTKEKTSREKQEVLRLYGAELVLCPNDPPHGHPDHYVAKAAQLARDNGGFLLNQYDNPLNVEAHYLSTGPEIWQQMDGRIDWFVTGGSTGGTMSGIMRYLRERDPHVRSLLADPVGSVYYGYHKHGVVNDADIGVYQTEGVGEDRLTQCIDFSFIDDAIQYNDDQGFAMVRALAKTEGIFGGTSTGGNMVAVRALIDRLTAPARIVTLVQDHGAKYVSKYLNILR